MATSEAEDTLSTPFQCYNFLSPNEYSEETFGLLAFLLRKSVGDINFSDLMDEVEKPNQQGEAAVFIALLEYKRDNLPNIEASFEKCLMINRLITDIRKNEKLFMSTVSHIRQDMEEKIKDNRVNQPIQYPNDFREREKDFSKRKDAQDMRRLFYLSHAEAKEPANLIYLKNRTTEHLNHLLDCRMRYEPAFRDIGLKEVFNIINTSFMIVAHPHCGVNPVIIYERKGLGEYTAKVSVIIVSLLHDFMQTHPNLIELCDIEPSLWPLSPHYKLIEPRSLSWKTCQLYGCPGNKPQIIKYAELSFITIQQTCETDVKAHFAQILHSLKFAIKFRVHLREYRFSINHQIILESSPFGIVSHNGHVSYMLTRVILDDIRRFSKSGIVDVRRISNFIQRYFIHRTGVKPYEHIGIYLEQELIRAKNERKNFQTLEDIFMDFLVPFVHQIEFMAKYPILAMFYVDRFCLGICTGERAEKVILKSSNDKSRIVGLRFNSITIDYKAIRSRTTSFRVMKSRPCNVRVDIYNARTKKIENYTFDSAALITGINKFVTSSQKKNTRHINILSNFNEQTNDAVYKSSEDFSKYYHERLHDFSKTDNKYKSVTNVFDIIDGDDFQNSDQVNLHSLNSATSTGQTTVDHEQSFDGKNAPMCDDNHNKNEASSQNVSLLPTQETKQKLIQYVVSQPDIIAEVLRQLTLLNIIPPIQEPQPQVINQNHQPQVQNIQMYEESSTSDICDFITTNQIPSISNDQNYEIYFDELVTISK